MGAEVTVTYPESLVGGGRLAEVERNRDSILLEGGVALQLLLKEHMDQLNARSRHGSNHWAASGVHDPVVAGGTVSVGIYIPGITRALHDVAINPVEARQLAIPVDDSARGMSPREWNEVHPGTLFRPKGKSWLGRRDGAGLVVMYILKDTVTQPQDPSLLPSDEDMDKAVMGGVSDAMEAILGD